MNDYQFAQIELKPGRGRLPRRQEPRGSRDQ